MNIFNSLARPYKLGRFGTTGNIEITKGPFFVENTFPFILRDRTDVHLYIFTLRYFLYAPDIRRNSGVDRSCACLDNLTLIERRKGSRGGGRERERERPPHFVSYIFSGDFTSDYFHILHTRNFALPARAIDRHVGIFSFAKVCMKRESSCLISSSGRMDIFHA